MIVGGGNKKQNMKTLKKFVALMTLAALVAGPAQALAQTTPADPAETTITTGFTVKTFGDVEITEVPVIKAVWETPDDYPLSAETQMDAPADCGQQKEVTVCAVLEDNSLTDLMTAAQANAVLNGKAWLYYDRRPGQSADNYDLRVNAESSPIALNALSKDDSIALFCNGTEPGQAIGTRIPGIVTYYERPGMTTSTLYDYADICDDQTGQLYKGTARVYCGIFNLSYESAAGDYEVQVKATDAQANNVYTPRESNWLTYVPWTAYEVDFDEVDYGSVAMNEWDLDMDGNNIGDGTWGPSTIDNVTLRPTVRNLGNTELNMKVWQSNMSQNGNPLINVKYKARVGSQTASWKQYNKETWTTLNEVLPLSTKMEMDFGIYTDDWLQGGETFEGTMKLDAVSSAFVTGTPTSIHLEYACPGGDFDICNND